MTHKIVAHENSLKKTPVIGFGDITFVDFSSQKFPIIARDMCEKSLHKVSGGLKFQCKKCARAFPCSNSLEIHEKECGATNITNGLDLSKAPISETEIKRMEFFSRLNLQDNSPEKIHPPNHIQHKLREQIVKAIADHPKDLADIQSILSNINLQQLQNKQNEMRLNTPKTHLDMSTDMKTEEEETQDQFAVEFRKMKLRGEFPCRLCTSVFPNLRALKGHNRAHLNGNNNGTYHCNMCPHSSIDKAALIRHMRTHNGDRPYECSLCNYAFTTKANCERHLRNRHSKTTREEVKKSIIYHPSEDPTNEDLNKLAAKDDSKRMNFSSSTDGGDLTPEKLHCSTPKIPESLKTLPDMKSELNLPKPNYSLLPPFKQNINEIICNENLRSLQEHRILQQPFNFPKNIHDIPQNMSKIQVKSLDALKDNNQSYDSQSEDEYNEDEDQPIDLSKKTMDDDQKRIEEMQREEDNESPQDLTKKSPQLAPFNINEFQLLKNHPAALYQASQLAQFYRNSFTGFPNWSYPLSPLLFSSIPSPLTPNSEDLQNKMRLQMCGGTMINDYKTLQNMQQVLRNPINVFNGYKVGENKSEVKMDNFSTPKKSDDLKPLNIDTSFTDGLMKMQSPIPQAKSEIMQSPNSVKMVIKNGVLMPKQKQRRYRTERPFTCEHCSARFTLRSNMERHIKQQHPQFWAQRQKGSVGNPGRKSQGLSLKPNYCDLSIPNYEIPKNLEYEEAKEPISEKLKYAILAQQRVKQEIKRDEDDDCGLVIDEIEEKPEIKTEDNQRNEYSKSKILEETLKELKAKCKNEKMRSEEDLVPVSRLLDNASQQQFKEYFKRDGEDAEVGVGSEEDEDGLVASGSTSEGNISGTDENK